MNKPRSIRGFLLTFLICALLATSAIIGAISYNSAKEEMNEIYNANLRQVALAIQAQYAHLADNNAAAKPVLGPAKEITQEDEFFVRVKGVNNELIYLSHPLVPLPPDTQDGFSNIRFQDQEWRVYLTHAQGYGIEVAQSLKYRKEAIGEVALALIIPQLVFIPLLGFLIWVVVGKSLRPLHRLSESINRRKRDLLEPVPLDNIPVEIIPLVDALNMFLLRLSGMVEILRRFMSDAAHELRTPLTALKLQLGLLERAENDLQRGQAITQLNAGIDRSISLVQQLLTLARVEPDAAAVKFVPVQLSALVKTAIEEFLPMAAEKNIDLGVAASSDDMILGDRESLRILLNNLIDNAIRYTPTGGRVDINLRAQQDSLALEVADNGPGIAVQDRERVFGRFYRGTGNITPGAGLGLAIVREIAERHQAEIALRPAFETYGLSITILFKTILTVEAQ
ncbi:MAG: two-component sensor histidine kinase [Alphaproteobacteria bacterium]|nr:two-component sensor histidine kinase [Alphaproteobacteria bacterium]